LGNLSSDVEQALDTQLVVVRRAAASGCETFEKRHGATVFAPDERSELLTYLTTSGQNVGLLVLAVGLEELVPLARETARALADVSLVIVAPERQLQQYSAAVRSLSPAAGQWVVLAEDNPRLDQQLEAQLKIANRRRRQRTTLDKVNLRIPHASAPDAGTLRRLVISERFLASLVEHSPNAIAALSLNGEILTWNAAAEVLWQCPAANALGRSLTEFVTPGDRVRLRSSLGVVEQSKQHVRAEFVAQRDAVVTHIELTIAPVLDEFGRLTALSVSGVDITARKLAESTLMAQKDALEQIVRGAELEHTLEMLTRWLEKVCGRDVIATILLLAGDRLRPVAGQRAPAAWIRRITDMPIGPAAGSCGTAAYHNSPVITRDIRSDPRWADYAEVALQNGIRACWSTPIVSSEQRVLGTVTLYYSEPADPTADQQRVVDLVSRTAAVAIERKQADDALRESRRLLEDHAKELEQRVAERTARLTETIEELEAFSYSVSHDLRTPLRAMDGYAEVLLEEYSDRLPSEAQHHLRRIHDSAERLEVLIRDVLTYSRLSKEDVQLQPIDLNAFLTELLTRMPELKRSSARVEVRGTMPTVLGHVAYLTQVFTNLIGNAVKFVRPGALPEITIEAVVEQDSARILVRDNGIGIDPAHFDRIFQMFGQVHPSSKYPGTGIGLTIVRKAVQRMGGKVGVESRVGEGACFWFTLKRAGAS
jgi:PAS domain S-box-containing protein